MKEKNMKTLQEDWKSALAQAPDEAGEAPAFPRKSDHVFKRHLAAITTESFVYRTNYISAPNWVKWSRTFVDDILKSGLLYTNDFKELLRFIKDSRNAGEASKLCDEVLGCMWAGENGEETVRGLYMFFQLRDCVRSQYRDWHVAMDQQTPGTVITRTHVVNLPKGRLFPDLYPPDGASAAVHVVPFTSEDRPMDSITPRHIQFWFGGWVDAGDLDRAQLKRDVESRNLERILYPYTDLC